MAHGLALEDVDEFLAELAALIDPVEVHFLWRPQLRDPCDEMVLEAAINGEVDALVTFNAKDFGDVPGHFGLELLLPRDVIMRMKQ